MTSSETLGLDSSRSVPFELTTASLEDLDVVVEVVAVGAPVATVVAVVVAVPSFCLL